jgi:sulfur transfer protein SufE
LTKELSRFWFVLSNQSASILEADMDFIDEIGLKDLSTRANGLVSMIKNIKCMLWHSTHKLISTYKSYKVF